MGGFGAISFAELIGADGFLAISPQYSLGKDFRQIIREERWQIEAPEFKFEHIASNTGNLKTGVIVYDPSLS